MCKLVGFMRDGAWLFANHDLPKLKAADKVKKQSLKEGKRNLKKNEFTFSPSLELAFQFGILVKISEYFLNRRPSCT